MSSMILTAAAAPSVQFETNIGSFTVELNPEKAPTTVKNFLHYVESDFYTGTIFHRVIKGFMIQGGGFDKDLHQKPTAEPIVLESRNGLKNATYTIAMARTSAPDSATAQFFINVVDNPMLDYPKPDGEGYAVFGKVTSGFDVIDSIKMAATHSVHGMGDVPISPISITSAKLVQ